MAVDLEEQVDEYGRQVLPQGDLSALANPARDGFILSGRTNGVHVWIPHAREIRVVFEVVTAGTVRYSVAYFAGTITGWNILGAGPGPTCTIDVWKITTGSTALPTVANTICGTKPLLITGNVVRSTDLTDWTTLNVSAGDIFGFRIDEAIDLTRIDFALELE